VHEPDAVGGLPARSRLPGGSCPVAGAGRCPTRSAVFSKSAYATSLPGFQYPRLHGEVSAKTLLRRIELWDSCKKIPPRPCFAQVVIFSDRIP